MSNISNCQAVDIIFYDTEFVVKLSDAQSVHILLDWFPRLFHSTHEERLDWLLIDQGRGIHWESIDEDISVAGHEAGRRSGESEKSLARWRTVHEKVKA